MFTPWNPHKHIFVQDDFMFFRYPTCYYIREKYFDLQNLLWFGIFWLFSDQYSNYETFIKFQYICVQFRKIHSKYHLVFNYNNHNLISAWDDFTFDRYPTCYFTSENYFYHQPCFGFVYFNYFLNCIQIVRFSLKCITSLLQM